MIMTAKQTTIKDWYDDFETEVLPRKERIPNPRNLILRYPFTKNQDGDTPYYYAEVRYPQAFQHSAAVIVQLIEQTPLTSRVIQEDHVAAHEVLTTVSYLHDWGRSAPRYAHSKG